MKFDLLRPCRDCPFRVDRPGYLHAARAQQIIDGLLADDMEWFGCHKTTEHRDDDEGYGERICVEATQQCAGSLILLWRLRQLNVVTRIAVALGMIDLDAIPLDAPVAHSREEFIEHHAKAWRREGRIERD